MTKKDTILIVLLAWLAILPCRQAGAHQPLRKAAAIHTACNSLHKQAEAIVCGPVSESGNQQCKSYNGDLPYRVTAPAQATTYGYVQIIVPAACYSKIYLDHIYASHNFW